WFKDVCKNEEKALKKMREAGLCVYVGKYCSNRLRALGVRICLEEKRAYCCFNSNLARIFQQCARSQLGISWGSGKNPNCRGLTVEEFSSVDLSNPRCQQLFVEYVNTYLSRLDLNTSVSEALGRVQGWINSQMQDFVNYGREPKRGY
ncbi:MAG: conjugal transfer protein TraN, partial [Desulfurococcaceae archaeon]